MTAKITALTVDTNANKDTQTRIFDLSASYAPEILEFWVHKLRIAKAEADSLKAKISLAQHDISPLQQEVRQASDLISGVQGENAQRRTHEQELRDLLGRTQTELQVLKTRIENMEKDKEGVAAKLLRAESAGAVGEQQIKMHHLQAEKLSLETQNNRQRKVAEMFPHSGSFFDPETVAYDAITLEPSRMQMLVDNLPWKNEDGTARSSLCFLPRPPACMPLHVTACGQHGYWFSHPFTLSPDQPFELIVEGKLGQWLYLGRYTTKEMQDYPMQLSEWIILDDATKNQYCIRLASSMKTDRPVTLTTILDIKSCLDSGTLSVPCFSLFCVGFSVYFYNALRTVAADLAGSPTRDIIGTPDEGSHQS